MVITYYEIIGSLRHYLQDTTNVPTIWKYYGYSKPDTKPFAEIEYVVSTEDIKTKTKELITEDITLVIGVHGDTMSEMSLAYKDIISILRYGNIPIYNEDFEKIGSFSPEVENVSNIMFGTHEENEGNTHRLYIEVSVPIYHVKERR